MERGGPILVAGAGAVGSVIGGLLARSGWPVTLLGRAAHMAAIATDGLRITGLFGDHHVGGLECVTTPDALRGPYAAVLVTVKSWDTASVVGAVASRLAADGVLLMLQNGLGNLEQAAGIVGPRRVLGARVIFGAELPRPGSARVTVFAEPVLIGSPDVADDVRAARAAEWAGHFAGAGIPAEPTSTLLAELWGKVFYNAALNPLGALLGVPYGHLMEDPDTRTIMDGVIDEAFSVARARGVALRWADAAAYRTVFYERLVPVTSAHRSSMLQDIERGRPTEIDAINGWVAREGDALGIPVPLNAALARLIRARARLARGDRSCR